MPERTRPFPLVLSVAAVATLLVPLGLSGPGQLAGAVPAEAKHRTATAGVGLFFLPQTPSLPGAVRFVASPPGARIAVLDDGLTVTLAPAPGRRAEHPLPAERRPARGGAIRLRFVEAAAASPVTGSRPLDAPVRYYIGDDERAWREDVRAFSRVEQRGLYPGIDVAYYGTGGLLEYDLTVAPGADVSRVRLAIDGARAVALRADGTVRIEHPDGEVTLRAPVVFQEDAAGRHAVHAAYELVAATEVRLALGAFDASKTLVIDPVVEWEVLYGGSESDEVHAVGIGPDGGACIGGETESYDLPGAGGRQAGWPDVFFACFRSDGTLKHASYLGGSDYDTLSGLVIDPTGRVAVTGTTTSRDFPRRGLWHNHGGGSDAFVAVFTPDGVLRLSTFLGGHSDDRSSSLAWLAGGLLAVTGSTTSPDFPLRAAAIDEYQGGLMRSADGGRSWQPRNRGLGSDACCGMAVDPFLPDRVYLAGDAAYLTEDGGDTWRRLGDLKRTYERQEPLLADAHRSGVLYMGLRRSIDGGATWERVAGLADTAAIRAVDPFVRDVLFAVDGHALLRSDDGGGTWTPVLTEDRGWVVDVLCSPVAPGLVWATTAWGWDDGPEPEYRPGRMSRSAGVGGSLHRSDDGGRHWTTVEPDTFRHLRALKADTLEPFTLHSPYYPGMVSRDGGVTWTAYQWRADSSPYNVVMSPARPGLVLMSATSGIWQSLDSGRTWERISDFEPTVMTVSPSDADRVYVWNRASDAFVAVIDPVRRRLERSTYFGGMLPDAAHGVTAGAHGRVYVAGATAGGLPAASGAQRHAAGGWDGFVAAFSRTGWLLRTTYLGGREDDHIAALAVDASGTVYATGTTYSPAFPVRGADTSYAGGGDVFITAFHPSLGRMVYSRFIGGSDADAPGAIAVDSGGRVIVGGRTRSADFPLALPLAGESGRAFLSMLDPSGRAILFASTLRSQPTPYFPGVVGVAVQGTRLVAGLGHYADGSQNVRLLSISLADLGEPPAGR